MLFWFRKYFLFLSILFITLLAFVLRWHNYAQFPPYDATMDERAWTWLGASLLTDGQPTSWSLFHSYEEDYIYQKREEDAPLVRPALDHPPLFSFIPGIFHLMSGQDTYDVPSQVAIRFPMILIGTFNVFLFALLAYRLTDKKTACVVSLFFASSPLVVASSRLVVADNLLATIVLAVLLIFTLKKQRLVFLMLLSALAILFKVQGVFIGAGLLLYFFAGKEYKSVALVIGSMIIAGMIFALYGSFFNWDLFVAIFTEQSGRMIGLTTLLHRFFFYPSMSTELWPTGEKSILFILTAGVVIYKHKDRFFQLLGSILIAYLVVALLAFDETNINGWYEYALFPLLFICTIPVIKFILESVNKVATWLLWLLLSLPLLKMLAVNFNQLEPFSPLTRKLLPLVGGIVYLPWPKLLQKVIVLGFLLAIIGLQIVVSWTLSSQSYAHQIYLLGRY